MSDRSEAPELSMVVFKKVSHSGVTYAEPRRVGKMTVKGQDRYFCFQCTQTKTRKWEMMLHVKEKHLQIVPFRCPECDFGTSLSFKFKQHLLKKHGDLVELRCKECSFEGTTFELVSHAVKVHRYERSQVNEEVKERYREACVGNWTDENDTDDQPRFQCQECGLLVIKADQLTKHMSIRHKKSTSDDSVIVIKDLEFPCFFCTYECESRYDLVMHIKSQHGDPRKKRRSKDI